METIAIPGAEIYYERNFLAAEEATKLFDLLQAKCAWERRKTLFKAAVPRDEAYYGDPGTTIRGASTKPATMNSRNG
ncbi:MAG TPA: hypothetical protein VEI52_20725 [Terriglobales bacterium]|nr:hypothetical protein [Terriglobales bacterium]